MLSSSLILWWFVLCFGSLLLRISEQDGHIVGKGCCSSWSSKSWSSTYPCSPTFSGEQKELARVLQLWSHSCQTTVIDIYIYNFPWWDIKLWYGSSLWFFVGWWSVELKKVSLEKKPIMQLDNCWGIHFPFHHQLEGRSFVMILTFSMFGGLGLGDHKRWWASRVGWVCPNYTRVKVDGTVTMYWFI